MTRSLEGASSPDSARSLVPAPARQAFRGLSVGQKLILIYIVGIFIPLVAANGFVLRGALRDARAQEEEFLLSTVTTMRDAIAREFEPIELVSEFVYTDRAIYTLLGERYERFQEFVETHRDFLVPALNKYAFVVPGISRITVYTENPVVGVSAGYLLLTAAGVRDAEWITRYERRDRKVATFVHVDANPRTEVEPARYISVIRELDATTPPRSGRMMLRIDVNPSVITRHLAPPTLTGRLELLDDAGNVAFAMATVDENRIHVPVNVPFEPDGPLDGWSLQGAVALAAAPIDPGLRWTLLFVVSGLSVAGSSVLILLLSRSVTARLSSVSRQMHRVEREDFSPVVVADPGDDEVGQLIADYNLMARKVESLINDRYRAEIERGQLVVARQQAELDALQSQVNPHYLFNVLESVRMKSHIRGEHETAAVVKRIARSIRRLTSWDDDLVPIGEEIDFTREYLEIQQYRFGERLTAVFNVDPEARSVPVPKLTVQGLVENACVHGLEPQTAGGEIRVDVRCDGDTVRLCVCDDGAGCDPDRVLALIHGRPSVTRHIGIANIYRRLKLHFGDRADFAFRSTPQQGTTVEVTLRGTHEPAETAHG